MSGNVVPQAVVGLLIDVHKFLDPEHIIGNVIDQIPCRFLFQVVIHRNQDIIRLPAPVLLPFKVIALERPVPHRRKLIMHGPDILTVNGHPFHHSLGPAALGQLGVLDGIRHDIRHDFPAFFPVIRNKVGIEHGNALMILPHILQGFLDQPAHQAVLGILRVGRHTGNPAHFVHPSVNVHLHGIDADL